MPHLLWFVMHAAAAPLKLAALEPSFAGLDEKSGRVYYDYFTQQLAGHEGLSVVRESDIGSVLGLERQKALAGCEDTSCTAELAGALGVDALLRSSIARAGGGFVVGINVIGAKDARPLATYSARPKDEAALLDFLATTADALAAKLGIPAAVAFEAPSAPRGTGWVAGAAVSAALLAAGGAFVGIASGEAGRVSTLDTQSYADVAAARVAGEQHQALGLALLAAGGLGAVSTVVLFALPASSSVRRWVPAIAGVVSLVAGIVLFALARGDGAAIAQASTSDEVEDLRGAGEGKQTAGLALMGCAALGAAGTAALVLGGGEAKVALAPTRGGAALSFTMRFDP
jgi:hypothetical protein